MKAKRQTGFTLIELMVTIAVALVALTLAVPHLVNLVTSNNAAAEVNDLASSINLARSEAIGRGIPITIAPVASGDWSAGWVIGIDADDDNIFPESGEPILRAFPAVNAVTFNSAPARLEYKATGEVAALANFVLIPDGCDSNYNRQRTLSVAMAGYIDLTQQPCP